MRRSAVYEQKQARVLAMQIFYQRSFLGVLHLSEQTRIDQLSLRPLNLSYLVDLLDLHKKKHKAWEQELDIALKQWKRNRLQRALQAIFWVALAEFELIEKLEYKLNLKIIIHEALEMTKSYVGEQAQGFCNGVLQKLFDAKREKLEFYDEV